MEEKKIEEQTTKAVEEPVHAEKHHKKESKKEHLLEEKNALLEQALAQEQDKVLRLNAELQNIQRHREEDIQKLLKYDGEELIKSLLPIIDNFERALSLENEENKVFLEGFKMIYKKLVEVLDNKNVKVVDQKDVEFDPAIHQAVLTEKVDGVKEGLVIDILQKGYKYKDRILRPAMVKVSE